MARASRRPIKTLTINKSRDFVVDRMTKVCEEENHDRCTGWALLKGVSSVNANYFIRCTCKCHKKGARAIRKKPLKRIVKKKKKQKRRVIRKGKKRKGSRRR